jgi:hypothetical protein
MKNFNMMKKALLLGSIPALAIAAGLFYYTSDSSEGVYEQRLSSHFDADEALIDGAFDYYQSLKGDYTQEQWQRAKNAAESVPQNRATFNWIDQGPDNIGGRTRGIVVDRNNVNHLFAGSVSGGLFESINRSSTWSRVYGFEDNLSVSSLCQTLDGTFYMGTGHSSDQIGGFEDSGGNGYGFYKRESDGSWTLVEGTESWQYVNEVVADDVNNMVWIASSNGLDKYDPSTGTIVDVDAFPSGACRALSISKDGTVLIGHSIGGGQKVFVSTNSGASFSEVSGLGDDAEEAGLINMVGVGRAEFAISHEKVDGKYRVYASCASGILQGVWRSANNGLAWERIAPAYDNTPGGFAPFTSGGSNGQGIYDNIITVVPGAPVRSILGGVDCYSWVAGGNWEQISQWFLPPTFDRYVHADNHEMVWDRLGRLYIGNDGGVAFSDNANTIDPEFHPANRGYNVTQFYAMGASAHGDVIGGSQDNGTLANYHTGTTNQEHKEVGGVDGFSADISFINRNLTFGSVYYSAVYRSSDRGQNIDEFGPDQYIDGNGDPCNAGYTDGTGCGEFNSTFDLWEHPYDLASTDTLSYIASQSYEAGETVDVPSATSQTTIPYVTPTDIVYDDTLFADTDLTEEDIVIIDELSGASFNLGVLDWIFIDGAPTVSIGDSLLIIGVEEDDTVIVASLTTIDHYYGTNPLKPGEVIDMGADDQIYNVAWDTIRVQDYFQSWFALDMGGGEGLWMTRNALRFSATTQGWFKVADVGDISIMEFSKDGNHLFIGTTSGALWRLSGFNEAYSPTEVIDGGPADVGVTRDTLVDWQGVKHVMELKQLTTFGTIVTGLATGPEDNPDLLIATLGTFSANRVRKTTNATGASPTFTIMSSFPSTGEGELSGGIPCYSVIIDRDDENIIVVGTEFGLFATENGGTSWENVSGTLGLVPVHDLEQNWRQWDEGCFRPGEIYAGTHARGIWSSDALLNIPSSDNLDKDKFIPKINLYPNPLKDAGTVEFDLASNGDVTIQIFNLSGQVVNQITANNLAAGKNQIAFDANDLPKGTYILRLTSGTMSETTKFIKH